MWCCGEFYGNVSFIEGMSKKGGVGAKIIDEHVKFLVDKFHCIKHTEPCCMPLDNPKCVYHPDLESFKDIHGTNAECAEQTFNWLGRYEHIVSLKPWQHLPPPSYGLLDICQVCCFRCKEDDTVQIQLLPVEHDKQP